MRSLRPYAIGIIGPALFSVILVGCGPVQTISDPDGGASGFVGRAMGGQQPITGATIQIYAANTTTLGGASTPLVTKTVTTSDGTGENNSNANAGNHYNALDAGYFDLTGAYTCPSPSTLVYLAASNGNSGAGSSNPATQNLVALGECGTLTSSSVVNVNEVTTVGTIAALYPYMTAWDHMGAPAAQSSALSAAFTTALEYMSPATGGSPGNALPSGYYASSTQLNTLANAVADCVNSNGGSTSDCPTFFADAKSLLGATPSTTADAVINVLNNPAANVTGIYVLGGTHPPFTPYLTVAPVEWTLPIVPVPGTPTFSPAGGTYTGIQTVTISDSDASAIVYYTTDGSTPTTSSYVYSSPITVSSGETLKALAVQSAIASSSVGTATYTIALPTASAPTISPAGGSFTAAETVTLSSTTPNAVIYYTTDGSTPTTSSSVYAAPGFVLSSTSTVKAFAAAAGYSNSGTSTATFTFNIPAGTISTLSPYAPVSATLLSPHGGAIDSQGNYYYADTGNNVVREISAAGLVTTIAGTGTAGYSGDGGSATSAELNAPAGITIDSSDNLYIADTGNNRIRMLSLSLTARTISTYAGTGTAGYSGEGVAATSAELDAPTGVTIDAASPGTLYIADTGNNRIRVVNSSGTISTLAPYTGTTSPTLSAPEGGVFDSSGNFYFADKSNNVVREFTASGTAYVIAGTGTAGYSGDGGYATSAKLNAPNAVAVDSSGNVYIADTGNNRVREVTAAAPGNGIIVTLAGNGSAYYSGDGGAAVSAVLSSPSSVAVDASGDVYIADTMNYVVREIVNTGSYTTNIINRFAGNVSGSQYGTWANGGAATNATIGTPYAIAYDKTTKSVYIASTNSNLILQVGATGSASSILGKINPVAGTETAGYSGDGGSALNAKIGTVKGLGTDASGNVYLTDESYSVVRKFAPGGTISTIAGTGTAGYSGDNGTATSAKLNVPTGVAVDTGDTGNIYICDTTNNRIRSINTSGVINTVSASGPVEVSVSSPHGGAFDSQGNYYFADAGNNVVRKISPSGLTSIVAGTGTAGYSGDGGLPTSAELNAPGGVAIDTSDNLYIADTGNNRIRIVSLASTGADISTYAGNGTGGYLGNGVAATSAELNAPSGVTLDPNNPGTVYIADTGNNMIRIVDSTGTIHSLTPYTSMTTVSLSSPQGGVTDSAGNFYFADTGNNVVRKITPWGIVTTVAGTGTGGYSGDGGYATSAQLNHPSGVAVDGSGNLYIADTNNNRVREVFASSGLIVTIAGNGSAYYSGDDGLAVLAVLSAPSGIACDSAGDVYIADTNNYKIRLITNTGSYLTNVITSFAGNGGAGAYATWANGGAATSATLGNAYAIAYDSYSKSVYIASSNSNLILQVGASGSSSSISGKINPVAGTGTAGYSGDGGAALSAKIGTVKGIGTDSSGNVYLTDQTYSVVRKFYPGSTIKTIAGTGTAGYSGDGGSATSAKLDQPAGVAVDSANTGNVYISDTLNNRIRVIEP